jgi:hypothetical protein
MGRFCESKVQGCSPWRGFGGVPQASLSFAAAGGVPKKPILVKRGQWGCEVVTLAIAL